MGKVEGNRGPSDWRRTVAEQGGDRKPRMSGENPLMAGAITKIAEWGRFGRFWTVLGGFGKFPDHWRFYVAEGSTLLRCSMNASSQEFASRCCSLPKKQQRFTNGTVGPIWTHLGPECLRPRFVALLLVHLKAKNFPVSRL